MLEKIIEFSIKRKLFIGFFTVMLMAWGVYSVFHLSIDAVPDITNNQVQVITTNPNLAPLEIEKYITYPVEISTANIPGLIETRSISRFGLSVVTLVFEDDVDVYWARAQVSERLKTATEMIPPGMGTPGLAPVSTGLSEIYQYSIKNRSGDSTYNLMYLRSLQDWVIKRELLRVKGVADVSSFGGYVKQYEVNANPDLMRSAGVTLEELYHALQEGNSNTGAAYIEKNDKVYFIRGIGVANGRDDLNQIVVKNNQGNPVLVKDVARVDFGHAVRYGAMTLDGEGETVGGILLMLKGENASQVIERVKEKIAAIQKTLPPGLEIEVFLDREELVNRAISTVSTNLIEGGLIVIFVLVLLLGNLRAGFVVASVIPLSMLFAIALMELFGVSGNLMSLGAIDFGLIVDGAVIIVEIVLATLHRKRSSLDFNNKAQLENEIKSASGGIMKSAVFGQLIILIVYIPILSLTGIEGKMFRPMSLTVIFAILGAFLLSLTYVPMMSALFLTRDPGHKQTFADRLLAGLRKMYLPLLNLALKRSRIVIGSGTLLLLLSAWVFNTMGGEFIPELNEGDYAIEVKMLPGTSLSQTVGISEKIERMLLDSFPDEIQYVVSKIGTSEIPTDPMPIEAMDIIVKMKDMNNWKRASDKEEMDAELEHVLSNFAGVFFSLQQPIQMRFNELMTSAKTDVVVKLYGDDLHTLALKAEDIASIAQRLKGAEDVQVQKVEGLPQVQVTYNKTALAGYGISVRQVNDVLQTGFSGKTAGVVFENERRYDMVLRLDKSFRKDEWDMENLTVNNPQGEPIPIKELATITIENGPSEIARDNTKRKINIGFNVRGRDVESLVGQLKKELDTRMVLPAGYSLQIGGEFENLLHAKARLLLVVPAALLVIFFLLYINFRSLNECLLVFSSVPLAAVGGVLSLWLRDMPFSISAGVGFIALFGVAVLNGIVLISHLNHLEQEGMSDTLERIRTGVNDRFRPVIMTALVASIGFLPMALSQGSGAEVQRPLATVVIGGLITSTLLTLVVLPALYLLLKQKRKTIKIHRLKSILFAVTLSVAATSHAQYRSQNPAMLQCIIDSAMRLHPAIQAASLKVAEQNALIKNCFNPPPLELLWQSPTGSNMRPSLLQSFDFPAVYALQYKSQKAGVEVAESEKQLNQAALVRELKDAYWQLAYCNSMLALLHQQDSLYAIMQAAGRLRFNVGDINKLEWLNAEASAAFVKTELRNLRARRLSLIYQLGMQSRIEIDSQFSAYIEPLLLPDAQNLSTEQNPTLAWYSKSVLQHKYQLGASKWRWMPGITIGYFNQTDLPNILEFYKWQFGLQLPVWFWSNASRVKAGNLSLQRAQTELQHAGINVSVKMKQAQQEYESSMSNLQYFEKTALPQAEEILHNASLGMSSGNLNIDHYLFAMEQAYKIKSAYLHAVLKLNENISQIQFLKGEIK